MLVPRGVRAPLLGIALLNDKLPGEIEARRRHDGIGIITFKSSDPTGFAYNDAVLEALFEQTSESFKLGKLLAGARIVFYVRKADGGGFSREFSVATRLCQLAWAVTAADTPGRASFRADIAALQTGHLAFIRARRTAGEGETLLHPVQVLPLPPRQRDFRGFSASPGTALSAAPSSFGVSSPSDTAAAAAARYGPPGFIKVCYGRDALNAEVPELLHAVTAAAAAPPMAIDTASTRPTDSRSVDVLISQFGSSAGPQPDITHVMNDVHALPLASRFPVIVFGITAKEHRLSQVADIGAVSYETTYPGLVTCVSSILSAQEARRGRLFDSIVAQSATAERRTISHLPWPV
jgi:hypothetical protein